MGHAQRAGGWSPSVSQWPRFPDEAVVGSSPAEAQAPMAEASGTGSSAMTRSARPLSAQAGGECAATQQLAEVGDQVHHVGRGERPTRGTGSVAGSSPQTSRMTWRIAAGARPCLHRARCRSAQPDGNAQFKGQVSARTARPGPARPDRPEQGGAEAGRQRSFTMASVWRMAVTRWWTGPGLVIWSACHARSGRGRSASDW